jgi:hypothetical protein
MHYGSAIRAHTVLSFSTLAFCLLLPWLPQNTANGAEAPEELLLRIIDAHKRLATEEVFLAQAKMLGAYLEAAGSLDQNSKRAIYTKVLDILKTIEISKSQASESPRKADRGSDPRKSRSAPAASKNTYEPGGAILEIFRSDSIEMVPDLPIMRTYWNRVLAYSDKDCILPERAAEIGQRSPYVARFSFCFEAKQSGQYGFTLVDIVNQKGQSRFWADRKTAIAQKLAVGGVDVAVMHREPTAQGVCSLKKGIHRIEFWFTDYVETTGFRQPRGFEVRVLTPDAFDAVPISAEMMLLKK